MNNRQDDTERGEASRLRQALPDDCGAHDGREGARKEGLSDICQQEIPIAEHAMQARGTSRWGLIFAGGEGSRLRTVTERIGGKGCPKQFCQLLGEKTLYEETQKRALHLFPADRVISVVTRSHAPFYPLQLTAGSRDKVVIQPENKGTAAAILYALLRLDMLDPNAEVAVLPSDHFVSDAARFMDFVTEGFESIRTFPNQVVLLGIRATGPETEYGWIETDTGSASGRGSAAQVKRFWEKPTYESAVKLWQRACLWNSFVLVTRVSWLLAVIEEQCPELARQFSELRRHIGSELEGFVAERTYRTLAETDFSKRVLMGTNTRLSVIRVHGLEWSDLGDPRRLALLTERGSVALAKASKRDNVRTLGSTECSKPSIFS